jgi:hypothetical protein
MRQPNEPRIFMQGYTFTSEVSTEVRLLLIENCNQYPVLTTLRVGEQFLQGSHGPHFII